MNNRRTITKLKDINSTSILPTFNIKLSGLVVSPESSHGDHNISADDFGHSFGNVRVESGRSFKQSCPLTISGPAYCPFGGACHTCPPSMQAKMKINQPGDKYEQEADLVAEQAIRMHEPRVQRKGCLSCNDNDEEDQIQSKPLTQLVTPLVQRQEAEPEEEEEFVQTKQGVGQSSKITPELSSRIQSLRGGGRPLPKSARAFFEPRFGYDFSNVRLHSESEAAKTASQLNARALTVGPDVLFGPGEYAPGSSQGNRLLAHELTHVVQQKFSDVGRVQRKPKGSGRRKQKPGAGVVVMIANGYKGYKQDTEEIKRVQSKSWLPNTIDFNFAGQNVPGDFNGASKTSEFIGALQGQKTPIKRVIFIGHGYKDAIGFSGDTYGTSTEYLDSNQLPTWQPGVKQIKFAKDATIDLFTCNTGHGTKFLQAMANTFNVCVRAFKGYLKWCIEYSKGKITNRGRYALPKAKTSKKCSGTGWRTKFNVTPPEKVCPKP